MDSFTKEKLEKIIDSNAFEDLKGEYENEWFDCKSQPYSLVDNKSKRELAKDVSSFANSNGGYILIGVKTTKDDIHFGDKIDEIKPFESNVVSREQVLKICEDWLYPKPDGLDFFWIASNNDPNKGIAVIKIPVQTDALKPFLIKNVLDEEKQIEIMFGYAERRRDNSQPYTLRDLQTILRLGLNYEQFIKGKFELLEQKIDGLSTNFDKVNYETPIDISERLKIIDDLERLAVTVANLRFERYFSLVGFTDKPNNLKSFAIAENGARSWLENISSLRSDGWTLRTYRRPEIVQGKLIRANEENYKIIELHREGTLIAAFAANRKFLAWGKNEADDRINQVALIEVIYNFVELYGKVLSDLEEDVKTAHIRIKLSNLFNNRGDNIKSYLTPNKIDSLGASFERKFAPEDTMLGLTNFDTENFDSRIVAFKVVREIYLWFGFDEDDIPYTKIEDNVKMIDPEQIRNLG